MSLSRPVETRGSESTMTKPLAWLFWLPVACLVGVEAYASQFEGWGAWATAPLFLVPLALSLVIGGGGLLACVAHRRTGTLRPVTVALTLVAALPLLWLLVRRYLV